MGVINSHLIFNQMKSITLPHQINFLDFLSFVNRLPSIAKMKEHNYNILIESRELGQLTRTPVTLITFLINNFLFKTKTKVDPTPNCSQPENFRAKRIISSSDSEILSRLRSIFQINFEYWFGCRSLPEDLGLFRGVFGLALRIIKTHNAAAVLALDEALEFGSKFVCLMHRVKKKKVLDDMKGYFLDNTRNGMRGQGVLGLLHFLLINPLDLGAYF